MEIKHLTNVDFYALRDLLDTVFTNKYSVETKFIELFPRLFTEPKAEVMDAHLGAFVDGRLVGTAAMYKLDYVVGGEHIKLVANGNVAVHRDYRGQGIMSTLLKQINDECDEIADLCYLHGDAVRYGRFGYMGGGIEYILTFQPERSNKYSFAPMQSGEVKQNKAYYEKRCDYILRSEEDFIPALMSGRREALSVFDENQSLVGYVSLNRNTSAVEEFAFNGGIEVEVFRALAVNLDNPVKVRLSGYDQATLLRCKDFASVKESVPALFRIINPERMRQAARAAGVDESILYAPYLT